MKAAANMHIPTNTALSTGNSMSDTKSQKKQKTKKRIKTKQKQKKSKKRKNKHDSLLEITYEETSSEEEDISSDEENQGCYNCKPDLYDPPSSVGDESSYLENLRRNAKDQLRNARNKKEKMRLDEELRMSYRQNIHQFGSKKKKQKIELQLCPKCVRQ